MITTICLAQAKPKNLYIKSLTKSQKKPLDLCPTVQLVAGEEVCVDFWLGWVNIFLFFLAVCGLLFLHIVRSFYMQILYSQ